MTPEDAHPESAIRAAAGSPVTFAALERLLGAAPLELGATGWATVEEGAVAAFRRATGTDAGAGGGTVVPALMLLSLTNYFLPQLMQVPAAASGVNYGAESARFGPPARIGQRVRGSATLVAVEPVAGGVQSIVEIRVEVDGEAEPACVVRSLSRWLS